MSKGNGETVIKPSEVDVRDALAVLIEAVQELTEKVDEILESHSEIMEKLDNMNLGGDGFGIED